MRKLKPTKKLKSNKDTSLKISACYIVKNEAHNLPKSLDSLKSQVDEIVIVDTGSTDNTIEIAESYGAKVLTSPWNNDFSTPRNLALDNATGDWIIFLDADEYFAKESTIYLRKIIEKAAKQDKNGVLVNLVNIDVDSGNRVLDTTFVLRAYKKEKGLHYVGRIHEELHTADGVNIKNMVFASKDIITLYHTGYSTSINEDKARRNLNFLLNELTLTDDPGRIYGYIAQCYNGLKDYANAEKYAILDINGGRRDNTFASSSYRILLRILSEAPERMEDRLKYTQLASKDFPETPEFHAELAECLSAYKKYPEAIKEMEEAIKCYKHYDSIEPMLFNDNMLKLAENHLNAWRKIIDKT